MDAKNILQKAREENRINFLEKGYRILKVNIRYLKIRSEKIVSELAEMAAPTEVELRSERMQGILESIGALLTLVGIALLIELSFKAFLSQSDFPLRWQRTVAAIFILGTILAFHFWLKKTPNGELLSPSWLPGLSVASLITGLLLLSTIRGLIVGNINQILENLRSLESWSRWTGVLAFCLLGLGLDIIAGIAGASAWTKLAHALPLLKWYRKQEKVQMEIEETESRLAEIEAEIGSVMEPEMEVESVLQPLPDTKPAF